MRKNIKTVIRSDYDFLIDTFTSTWKKNGDHGKFRKKNGADFFKIVLSHEENEFLFQIWEIGPKNNDKKISVYYSGAVGGIIIFDKSKKVSFANVPDLVSEVWNKNGRGIIPLVIVGFEDQKDSTDTVTDDLASRYCEKLSEQTKNYGFEVSYFSFKRFGKTSTDICFQFLGMACLSYFKALKLN